MHYQIKNEQIVPISNEELEIAKEHGKDPKKGIKQRRTVAREEPLKENKEKKDELAKEDGMAKKIVTGSEAHEHTNKPATEVTEPTIEL